MPLERKNLAAGANLPPLERAGLILGAEPCLLGGSLRRGGVGRLRGRVFTLGTMAGRVFTAGGASTRSSVPAWMLNMMAKAQRTHIMVTET